MELLQNARQIHQYVESMVDGEEKELINAMLYKLLESTNQQFTKMKDDYTELNEKWKESSQQYDHLFQKYEECVYNQKNTAIRFANLLTMAGVKDGERYL